MTASGNPISCFPMTKPIPAHKFVQKVWGKNVRKARLRLGLSQVQLAELIDTTQSVVSEFETGDYRATTTSLLLRFSIALNEDPGDLFEWPYAIRALAERDVA